MKLRLVGVIALCLCAFGFQPERDKEVYRIYSLLMTRPATSHGADNNPRYLIAATTALPLPLEPCVKPPKEREAEFQEILADLEARKAAQKTLKRELTLAKPYELLSPEQVRAFQAQRGRPTPAGAGPTPSEFAGAADVFTLSDVYFSQNGKLALKAVSTWCGGLCGQQQWKVLEKLPTGEWVERPWVLCSGIARGVGPDGKNGF